MWRLQSLTPRARRGAAGFANVSRWSHASGGRKTATGPNALAQEHKRGALIRVLTIIRNPLVILRTILSVLSYLTGDGRAGTVMAMMVWQSVGLRFIQKARADAAAQKLKAMIHVTASVVRDNTAREIMLRDLVPGDIIKLAAGDMIRAMCDCCL